MNNWKNLSNVYKKSFLFKNSHRSALPTCWEMMKNMENSKKKELEIIFCLLKLIFNLSLEQNMSSSLFVYGVTTAHGAKVKKKITWCKLRFMS